VSEIFGYMILSNIIKGSEEGEIQFTDHFSKITPESSVIVSIRNIISSFGELRTLQLDIYLSVQSM
jgi:hypothetical protein